MKMKSAMLVLSILLAVPCGAATQNVGIQSMLVGDKVLELTDNHQLTLKADGEVMQTSISPDGKYVIYLIAKEDAAEWRLAKTSTGRTIKLMDADGPLTEDLPNDRRPASGELWMGSLPVAWSPDSSQFAIKATRRTWEKDKQVDQPFITIYSASGTFKKALPAGASVEFTKGYVFSPDALMFTPDSRKLVTNLLMMDLADPDTVRPLKPVIELIDIATGASRDIYTPKSSCNFVGWSSDGSLLLTLYGKGTNELHKIALDGGSDQVIVEKCGFAVMMSADGVLIAVDRPSLTVKNQLTGKQIELATDIESFQTWAPNSRMLLYTKKESIADTASKDRKRDFKSLWLSSVVSGKLNHMCIALDADDFPSCSRDCHRIAYISQGQLYIAELTTREPKFDEKLVVGLPLTEDETKHALLNNAKQIAVGIIMYSDDNGDKLPPSDSVATALHDYLPDADVFCRPGTGENIFKFVDPGVKTMGAIDKVADTPLGELDAGYSWKVVLYADGHVKITPKQ